MKILKKIGLTLYVTRPTMNSALKLRCISFLCSVAISSCYKPTNGQDMTKNPFFEDFQSYDGYNAHFRVGFSTDTTLNDISIKAITTAFFDSLRYTPKSTYIISHKIGDSIVINTSDMPLLSHSEFSDFYSQNKERNSADTIISPSFIERFRIEANGRKNVESFQYLPFAFMDVNFDGKPELLIRERHEMDYFIAYELDDNGLIKMQSEPYNYIKSRTGPWCYGGSTEFDFDKKSVTVHSLSAESCSDYGTSIVSVYTMNPANNKFALTQKEYKYDHGGL